MLDPRTRRVLFVAAALALVWLAGTIAAPWSGWLRLCYAPLCHQLPERSLQLHGVALGVCARCLGLYLGGSAALIVAAALRSGRWRALAPRWFWIAVAPTLLDVALPWLGLPGLPNLPRLGLAVPAGAAAGLFLAVGIADLFRAVETPVPVALAPGGELHE
ncbi:MAG TPA: DUF2085 domain-containing protein [Candidatus Polarisedimenticolaceae bacterium]|nr:DUF2085 domain-containing protein [Candidatus Polarisedimenticolaceae bacterium]